MNKLRNKIFFTLLLILTISILSFILVFNVQNYIEQKNSVISSLEMATNNGKKTEETPPEKIDGVDEEKIVEEKEQPEEKQITENIMFMDATVYTALLDEEDNVKDVINHSNNGVSNDDIIALAQDILSKDDINQEYIGNLYFDKYSYSYTKGNSLVILDNYSARLSLLRLLKNSIIIFVLLEAVVVVIVKFVTDWIVKPVKESFDRQKQFIADASHELKTPVSVILASSEALEESPKEMKWLKNIKNEAERMNLLITDLLELALSEHKENLKFSTANLSKAVELSVLTFEGKAFEKNIKLKYDIQENISYTMNEENIKQLVEILLDNAIKHSESGEDINVSLKENSNNIELVVKNKGDEIPKGEEEKIFERFYRVDKSRNRKENCYGLGLAIAKNIVENHNGKISAKSDNNITTFKVLLKK